MVVCGRDAPTSLSVMDGRADSEVIRVGKVFLPQISCSTWESGAYTSPEQRSRGVFDGVSVGEPTL